MAPDRPVSHPVSRCDDCYVQVEPMDWYGHRMWHKDQDDTFSELQSRLEQIRNCDCDENLRPDVTKLEEQMQDVIDIPNLLDSDLIPRLEKLEEQLNKT
jgi:hypothetical protein